ncbi:MAG TPA: hypothetical protein DIT05_12385 [Morganella sp. (in: Bacteria)]|nr:hypothetical protein [Morganella sp. (in: enterobacteria)]
MKSFLHYRLVIFAALITCGIFTGSCRAETDISCLPLHMTIQLNTENGICFSKHPVPTCPKICHLAQSVNKSIIFSCVSKDNPYGKPTDSIMTVAIPERCELTLPVAVKPVTEQ